MQRDTVRLSAFEKKTNMDDFVIKLRHNIIDIIKNVNFLNPLFDNGYVANCSFHARWRK